MIKRLLGSIVLGALFFAAGWRMRGAGAPAAIPPEKPTLALPTESAAPSRGPQTTAPAAPPAAQSTQADRLIQEALNEIGEAGTSKVIELFESALRLDPKNESGLANYSNFLVLTHDCDSAMPILKQCVENYPKNQLCQGNSAVCVSDNPDALDQATQDCLQANPQNMMCLNSRGQLHLRRKEFEEALAAFEQMETLNGHTQISFPDGVIDESLALAYEGLGRTASAREYYLRGCDEGMPLSCRKSESN